MQRITSIINNQQGSVILIAIIILAMLTIIGISATNISNTEMKITTNALLYNVAFYTADAGIEAGRAVLNNLKTDPVDGDAGYWDLLLRNLATDPSGTLEVITWNGQPCTTLNEVIDAVEGRRVGPAAFSLVLADNEDRDNMDEVDTDNTVVLTSTASYRGSTITIQAIVQAGGGGGTYAQEHYDAGSSGEALAESAVADSVQRW
jgi:type II secretory pathway component PulK